MTREEAIEIYKGLMNPNIIEAFEVLVPELKEIGYDRMREQIIRGFENWKSNGNLTFNNLRVDDILAWFEKEKEQKPVPISCSHENGSPAEVCYSPKGDPDPADTPEYEYIRKDAILERIKERLKLYDPDDPDEEAACYELQLIISWLDGNEERK